MKKKKQQQQIKIVSPLWSNGKKKTKLHVLDIGCATYSRRLTPDCGKS